MTVIFTLLGIRQHNTHCDKLGKRRNGEKIESASYHPELIPVSV